MDDLRREIMIMKRMKHNNIVTLSEVIDDPGGSKLMLVMEYMDRGPVLTREALERRERLPEPIARHYFRDMVKVSNGRDAHVAGFSAGGSWRDQRHKCTWELELACRSC